MSHPVSHSTDEDEEPIMLKPRPRGRPFDLSSEPSSPPDTPTSDLSSSQNLQTPGSTMDGSTTPSRTRSILNLTSSTLFGIYQPTGYATDREEPSTPWGTGAETPIDPKGSFDFTRSSVPDMTKQNGHNGYAKRRRSTITPAYVHHRPRRGFKRYVLPLVGRLAAMSVVGVLYGVLISHLHDRQKIAPVDINGLDRQGWPYLSFWAVAGVLLGEALPRVDKLLDTDDEDALEEYDEPRRTGHRTNDWMDVVRAVGAFVGVAFAIRRLPWESTMQLSLTLALANPALWYVIDRSAAGFLLSSVVALGGTAILSAINPAWMPAPGLHVVLESYITDDGTVHRTGNSLSDGLVLGLFSQETVGVVTWIASVLFVSSVCFGNIGRRLVPRDG